MRTKVCGIALEKEGEYLVEPDLGKCYKLVYTVQCLDGSRQVTLKYVGKLTPGLDPDRDQELAKPGLDSEVWVSCTCPFHLYNTEYALTHHESSDIIYSNGNPAHIKNPTNIGFCCKHVMLALQKSFNIVPKVQPKKVEPTKPSEPAKPSEPTKKVEPTKPSEPTKTVEPGKPSEPTKPTKPSEPTKKVEPAKPSEPTKPTKPIEPTKKVEPAKPSKQVSWGDRIRDWLKSNKKVNTPEEKSWRDKLTDWLKTDKEVEPKGKAPKSWKDRLTKWLSRK